MITLLEWMSARSLRSRRVTVFHSTQRMLTVIVNKGVVNKTAEPQLLEEESGDPLLSPGKAGKRLRGPDWQH